MSSGSWGVFHWGSDSPVAQRPEDSQFFPVNLDAVAGARRSNEAGRPIGSTQAADYRDLADGSVLEPQVLAVLGRPSMNVYRDPHSGSTVIQIRRNLSNISNLTDADLGFVDEWSRTVIEQLRAHSQGPYKPRDLRRMGHPYGFEESWAKGDDGFKRRHVPGRAAPRGVNLRVNNAKGVRGTIPTLAVINRNTGRLQKSWSSGWMRDETGFTIELRNAMPYAWYLAHGTMLMQPHGPFVHVPLMHIRRLDSALHRAIARLRFRNASERVITRLIESVS